MRTPHPRLVQPRELHPLARKGRPLVAALLVSCLMWAGIVWLAGCFSATAPTTIQAQPAAVVKPLHNPMAQVYVVDTAQGWGSCVPIHRWADFTVFITARHVAQDMPCAVLADAPGSPAWPVVRTEFPADPEIDLALMLVQVAVPVVELSRDPISFGDEVFANGWVAGYRSLTHGYISSHNVCSADVYPGMSGGGIFRNGRLIGVVHAVAVDADGGQPMPFMLYVKLPFVNVFQPISKSLPWIDSMLLPLR